MSLKDDLAAIKPRLRSFADWLATDPPEAAEVIDMMRDPNVAVTDLTDTLRKHGIPCGKDTVRKYRNGSIG